MSWMDKRKNEDEPCFISFPPTDAQCNAVGELLDRKGMISSGTVDVQMPDGRIMTVDRFGTVAEVGNLNDGRS